MSRGGAAGWSLPEVVAALLLTGLLALAAAGAVEGHRRVLDRLVASAVEDEAVRVVRGVLRDELRGGGVVVAEAGGDSLPLRAYRAGARVCGPAAGSQWRVESWGLRRGDPEKDSVEILGADGRRRTARLVRVWGPPAPCALSGGEIWRIDPPQDVPPVLLLAFERGGYHLAAGALRYRRGAGGRQPLTPELFHREASGLEILSGELRLRLVPAGDEGRERVVRVPLREER